jgi:hypothetical protein
MNRKQFAAALALAESQAELPSMLGPDALLMFDGFALADFSPVTVTVRDVAALIRYQAGYIMRKAGTPRWDADALAEIESAGRTKFNVVGGEDPQIIYLAAPGREVRMVPADRIIEEAAAYLTR